MREIGKERKGKIDKERERENFCRRFARGGIEMIGGEMKK